MARILAVDDEKEILEIIRKALEKDGHEVVLCKDGDSALKALSIPFQLILLDIMMPEMDGFELCVKIRNKTDCPIIFLTAKSSEPDIIKGLSIGADDYLKKPFGLGELRARVMAHMRREGRQKSNSFIRSGLVFYTDSKKVMYQQKNLLLTKSEYDICEYLAINHGITCSKERIFESVFGFNADSDSSAIVEHIKNIRKKGSAYGLNLVETVWGIGYRWAE
ncbi:response regulator transcription factor [Anaerosacchariphilus polymeriproducens]|uniref:Stage 0 sporulation protein A homolog n=1 Tax=Anaerosacchariphilus polymeriproducens TaxID=1812858 RepID=A0A371AXB0_9FIRM|nr:response regulator transcription factor [Anaerosacchariphilus polymeriproducens]RDU24218.1 DNA-binding response regulator [Anaerosacchariphilus polymeriproducens]